MKKLYLGELIKKYQIMDNMEEGQINLIHAYAGSGKTTYILDMIDEARCGGIFTGTDTRFYYVCDSILLKQQFKGEYATQRAEVDGIALEQLYKIGQFGEYIPESCHIMTYYGWLFLMRNLKSIDVIKNSIFIFDECSTLTQNCNNEQYIDYDEEEIIDYIDLILDQSTLIAMSATPELFNGMMIDNGFDVNDLLQGHKDELRQYTSSKVIKYHEKPHQLLSHIPHDRVAIYWCGAIKDMEKEAESIRALGLNVCCVYSDDRDGLTEERKLELRALKSRIVKDNDVPQEYDVIIYNKTMGTGVNILDTKHEFDTFITYSTKHEFLNDDDIYQARMRIRHDIECEYRYTKAHDIKKADKDDMKQVELNNRRIELIESVIDKRLTTAQFKALCDELAFRNAKREIMGATSVKKEIEKMGYKVSTVNKQKVITK